jgi:hypothetical protein
VILAVQSQRNVKSLSPFDFGVAVLRLFFEFTSPIPCRVEIGFVVTPARSDNTQADDERRDNRTRSR